jgi:glucose/arabinose dehydrogenase
MARLSPTFLLLSLLAAACGGTDAASPPTSPPPSGSGETVTGRERFGWTQAAGASEAGQLQFAAYVDGVRTVLEGASCNPGSGDNLDCSAPLPPMTPGRHTLELAAFYSAGATTVEGPKSPALQLTIAAVTADNSGSETVSREVPPPENGSVVASDGSELVAEVLGADLLDPVDVAVDPAGRSFVAERGGGIRIFDPDGSTADGDRADDLSTARDADAVVLSIALAPDFAKSHLVYALKVTPGEGESQAILVRYREADGRFGQSAVIASAAIAGSDPTGLIRFGPDGALYVGLGSRTIDPDTRRAPTDSGRILRLTTDGRTPRDNPGSSPVYSSGHRDPSGFAWHRAQRTFWEVESGVDADEVNSVLAGGDYGWPLASGRTLAASTSSPRVLLPAGTIPTGMTTVDDEHSPLDSDLIVSSLGLQDLLRIEITEDGQPAEAEPVRLLQGRFGAIGQVTAGPAGALYIVTRNRDAWGAGRDVLVRLSPQRVRR